MLLILSIILLIIIGSIAFYYLKKYILKKYLLHQFRNIKTRNYEDLTKEYVLQNPSNSINNETFNDAEMMKVFETINYTITPIGTEYLYNSFFNFDTDFKEQERVIEELSKEHNLEEVLVQLHKINKEYIPILNIKNSLALLPKYYLAIISSLFFTNIVCVILTFINISNARFLVFSLVINILTNIKLSEKGNHINTQISLLHRMTSSLQIVIKRKLYSDTINNEIRDSVHYLKNVTRLSLLSSYIEKVDILSIFEIIKYIIFFNLFQALLLKKHATKVHENILVCYKYLGLLDTCVSIISTRLIYETCIPTVLQEEKVIIKDGYHPLIKNPICNSIVIENDILITGSNASGKSTFLKMVAANMILAQSINTCFAKEFQYYPYHLISSIHMKDDIEEGNSYYMQEIKILKNIVDQATTTKSLVIIDEILKGTNEKERLIIARSIVKYLFSTNSRIIISTHDLELLEGFDDIDKYCFNDHKENNNILFDYKIKEGICTVGNAIAIVQKLQFDQTILDSIQEQIYED